MKGGTAKKIYHLTFYVKGRRLAVTDPVTAFMYPVSFLDGFLTMDTMLLKIRRAINGGRKRSGVKIKKIVSVRQRAALRVFDIDHMSMTDD